MFRRSALALGSALGVVLASGAGLAQTGKVTVVTSFSKDVTDPIKKAFEKAVPGATLEVQNRNTNAGVKFIEETKGNNQVDLFWASAPDAFEVLKGLLEVLTGIQLHPARAVEGNGPLARRVVRMLLGTVKYANGLQLHATLLDAWAKH